MGEPRDSHYSEITDIDPVPAAEEVKSIQHLSETTTRLHTTKIKIRSIFNQRAKKDLQRTLSGQTGNSKLERKGDK